jgi:hypothetical protein
MQKRKRVHIRRCEPLFNLVRLAGRSKPQKLTPLIHKDFLPFLGLFWGRFCGVGLCDPNPFEGVFCLVHALGVVQGVAWLVLAGVL